MEFTHNYYYIMHAECCTAQGVDCYIDNRCSGSSTFGTIEECCSSPNDAKSYQVQGGSELCEQCQCKFT